MDLYQRSDVTGYEWLQPERDADWDVLWDLSLRTRGSSWQPLRVRLVRGGPAQGLAPADLPSLGFGALGLKKRAMDALHDVLEPWGEILPLTCTNSQDPMWAFNCGLIDALDLERSQVERFPDGRVKHIAKAAFKPEAVPPGAIFRLPEHPRGGFYTTSVLVDRVREAGLTGCTFTLVGGPKPVRKTYDSVGGGGRCSGP